MHSRWHCKLGKVIDIEDKVKKVFSNLTFGIGGGWFQCCNFYYYIISYEILLDINYPSLTFVKKKFDLSFIKVEINEMYGVNKFGLFTKSISELWSCCFGGF
jgi:hypothetical protein